MNSPHNQFQQCHILLQIVTRNRGSLLKYFFLIHFFLKKTINGEVWDGDGHLAAAEKKGVHDADCQLQNEKHNCKKNKNKKRIIKPLLLLTGCTNKKQIIMIKKIKRLQKVFPHSEKKKYEKFQLGQVFNVSFKGRMI